MNNPFAKIKNSAKSSLQEIKKEAVIKKQLGRPRRPNMGKYLIKLDKVLHAQLTQKSDELGCSRSFVIAEALREYLN